MSVVANIGINVDSSGAVSKLRQVQTQATATERAAQSLTRGVEAVNGAAATTGRQMQVAANGMRFFTDAAGRARKENGQFVTTAEAAAAGIKKQGQAAQGAARDLSGLRGALASIGAGVLVAGMVRGAASAEQLQLRLKLLSREYGETERVQQLVAQSAKTFGQSQVEAAAGVTDVYARLRPLGTSLAQIETVYKGFNAVALASGTSAEAASGAFLQLSQALGSGRLQGDEFRSIAEQVPGILRLVADEMGVTVGQLKQLGSEGKITSDVLINALAKGFDENKNKIGELLALSPAQRFKEFRDATQALSNAMGSELLPAIVPVVKVATELLRLFGQLPGPMKTIIAAALGLTAAFVALAPAISATIGLISGLSLATLAAAGPWIALAAGITTAAVALAGYRTQAQGLGAAAAGGGAAEMAAARNAMVSKQQEISLLERQNPSPRSSKGGDLARARADFARLKSGVSRGERVGAVTRPAAPNAMNTKIGDRVGGGGGGGGGINKGGGGASAAAAAAERAAEAATAEAARVKDVIRDRLAEGQLISVKSELQARIAASEEAGDKMLTARLQAAGQQLDIQYRYAQELAKENNLEAQKAIMYQGMRELTANQIELQRTLDSLQRQSDQDRLTALQKHMEKQYELNSAVQNQLRLADGISNTLGEGLGSAFNALISGAESWENSLKQIASGVLNDIANQLIRIFIVEQAINSIKQLLTPFSASTPMGAGGGMVGKFGTLGPNFGIPQRAKGGPVLSFAGGGFTGAGSRSGGIDGQGGFMAMLHPWETVIDHKRLASQQGATSGDTYISVSVDASGSKVQGDDQQGRELGRVIAAAVQAELIKQKRPGGVLA